MSKRSILAASLILGLSGPAWAQFSSGSDGSDGPLNITANTTIDLSLAASGPSVHWNTPSPVAGNGVYDSDKWAVVFKYTTITIASGATVTFTNHPSRAPVIWLATGDFDIGGVVSVDGQVAQTPSGLVYFEEPGPGGFRGGRGALTVGVPPAAGFGPGGANIGDGTSNNARQGAGGSYAIKGIEFLPGLAGSTYGWPGIFPLIGGSGGSGSWPTSIYGTGSVGGGAGGGAILLASSTRIILGSSSSTGISARGGSGAGGNGPGSGGAIRLIANEISGPGKLDVLGGSGYNGSGGFGRSRVEAYNIVLTGAFYPVPTQSIPSPVFPSDSAPTLRATLIQSQAVPVDPCSRLQGLGANGADVVIAESGPVTIHIQASNVPVGTTVTVRVVPAAGGDAVSATSTAALAGTLASSTATATVTFPRGFCAVQLRANWTP